MRLLLSSHHLEVTPAISLYVDSRFEKISRHFDQVVEMHIHLSIERQKEPSHSQKAECTLHVKGHQIFAEAQKSDLYAAIDELSDKIDRLVIRHKERIQDHHHDSKREASNRATNI